LFHYNYTDDVAKGELSSVDVSKFTNIRNIDRIGFSGNLLGLFSYKSTTLIDITDSAKKADTQLERITKGANSYLLGSNRDDTFLVTVSGKDLTTYRHDALQVTDQPPATTSGEASEQNMEWQIIPSMQAPTSSVIRQVSQNSSGLGIFTDDSISTISIRDLGPAIGEDQAFDTVKNGRIVEGSTYGDRDVWLITTSERQISDRGNKLFYVDMDGKITDETASIKAAFNRIQSGVKISKTTRNSKVTKIAGNAKINKLHPGIRHVAAVKYGCYVSTDKGVVFISLPEYRKNEMLID
jgi:hypothetical protein